MNDLVEIFNKILSLYDGQGIDRAILEQWSIKQSDFLVIAQEMKTRKPNRILEIGTFVGVSTFLISSILNDEQEIYSIDPNLPLADEVEAVSDKKGFISKSIRTLDAARETKNRHFADRNINFLEGCLNYDSSYSGANGFHKFLPDLLNAGIKFDLIFIDGLHYADVVLSDLDASAEMLSNNGVILLHDGRGLWAEEVLFGVCKFIQKRNNYALSRFPDSSIVKLQNVHI